MPELPRIVVTGASGFLGLAVRDYDTMTIEFGIDRILEVYEDAESGAEAEG